MDTPIIAAYMADDRSIQTRLTPCSLSSYEYGIVLADLARQIAKMFAMHGGHSEDEAMAHIVQMFNREAENPTSSVEIHTLNG